MKMFSTALMVAALGTGGVFVGCDRATETHTSTTTDPQGKVVDQKKTETKVDNQGNVTETSEKKTSTDNR